jgi:hypothetical protein
LLLELDQILCSHVLKRNKFGAVTHF